MRYQVQARRTIDQWISINIDADSEEDAIDLVSEMDDKGDLHWENSDENAENIDFTAEEIEELEEVV